MSIKRRTVKIIIAVIVLAIIIAVLVGVVIPILKVNQVKNKLSEINAKELQNKIIERLEKSPINIDTETTETAFRKLDSTKTKLEDLMDATYELVDVYNNDVLNNGKTEDRPYQYFVSAYIVDKNDDSIGVAYPCFNIESDSNGNVKSIEIIESYYECKFIERIIKCEIENVLKNEYGIDTSVINDLRYKDNKTISFSKNAEKLRLHFTSEKFLVDTFETISNQMGNNYGAYSFKPNELIKEEVIPNVFEYVIELDRIVMTVN